MPPVSFKMNFMYLFIQLICKKNDCIPPEMIYCVRIGGGMTMTKPIIAVDMDDTICHLVKRAIYHNNISFPTHPLQYEDMVHWDTTHLRHPESTHDVFYGRPGLFEELELYDEYVVEEMRKLNDAYDLIIVTAAEPRTVGEKWNWS